MSIFAGAGYGSGLSGGSNMGLGGYMNPRAARAGIQGPAAMNYQETSPVASIFRGMSGAGPGGAGINLQTMLTQLLQAGPQMDQSYLTSTMDDLAAQESRSRKDLQNRFSGLGRPLASSEYGSQEAELLDVFNRARGSARTNASRAGLDTYNAQANPLLKLLQLAQSEFMS